MYLHDRPERDVFKLLIESFRMRQADDLDFENKATPRSIYTGAPSSIEPFRQYLAKAATRPKLLPPWWTADKQEECALFGESGAWSDLKKKVTKHEMIQHYGDPKLPMQVRMLAEMIIGIGTMGQDGSDVRKMMMQVESGGLSNGGHMSTLDIGR
jgi:splicing suppressor protein 51